MKNSFIHGLAEHIKNNYDLKSQELAVVFPNKRAAFYLRSEFKTVYHDDIWLPQMLSIQEAMTQWSGIQLVDTIDLLFELLAIDSEMSKKDTDISIFGSMAAQMAKDFDEIDQYNVDANHLFTHVYEDKCIGTWIPGEQITQKEQQYLEFFNSLKKYYDKLRSNLEQQGKGYYGMLTRYLASLDDNELIDKTNNQFVIFAGFNALTPTEQRIIDKLFKNHRAEVIWDFDHYYVDDEQNEAGLFARRYIQDDVPWKPKEIADNLCTETKKIHLVAANGNTIQSKALQTLLQVEVEDNIAVVLADENMMIPVLNSIPDTPRYPSINVSMGYPLRQTALNDFMDGYFTLRRKGRLVHNEGWYIWPILRILDLEIIKVIFNKQEINELYNFRDYVFNKSIFIYKEAEFKQHCKSKDLQQFMKLLLEAPITSLLSFISNKIQSFDKHQYSLFLLNQVSEVGKIVNRLNNIMERYQREGNKMDETEILYRLLANNTSIKLNSSKTNGLQLMGFLEARNLDFNTIYMVGVNEGILPSDKSNNSFIPYQIRKENHLPDYQEKQAVYAYHFYRLLQNADKAYFIYNTNGSESGGEPSRFLLQLRHELSKRNPNVEIIEEIFPNKTEKTASPNRIVANKSDVIMEKLLQKIETENIKEALAPTSLSAYNQCPLRFFLRYILMIKDNSAEEETQNNIIGTVVHDTLELLYINNLNTLINKDLFNSTIKPSLSKNRQKAIAKNFGQGLPDVGYNYLNSLTIDKLFDNYIRYEEREIAKHELSISKVEHTLHTKLKINGIDCTIAGKADRIDCSDGVFRIIDYKTGRVSESDVKVPSKITSVRDIPEKAFQLLIYKYLYLKEHPETSPDSVTAALFGLRNQKVCFGLKIEYQALNDDFLTTMEGLLTETLTSMLDRDEPFAQPKDTKVKPCHFCDFQRICANTATGAQLVDGR